MSPTPNRFHWMTRLLTLDNCLIVPHIASASVATRTKMAEMAVDNVIAGLARRAPADLRQSGSLRLRGVIAPAPIFDRITADWRINLLAVQSPTNGDLRLPSERRRMVRYDGAREMASSLRIW